MDYKTIKVHAGKGNYVDVIVSPTDYDYLAQWAGWQLNSLNGYARRTIRKPGGKYGSIYMHRLIINAPDGIEVDHINGNALDNRRCNLRIVTRTENLLNKRKASSRSTVGYVGVERHRDKYVARIKLNGKRIYIGSFTTKEEASAAYIQYKLENCESFRIARELECANG